MGDGTRNQKYYKPLGGGGGMWSLKCCVISVQEQHAAELTKASTRTTQDKFTEVSTINNILIKVESITLILLSYVCMYGICAD
jgi:hypothetical protein